MSLDVVMYLQVLAVALERVVRVAGAVWLHTSFP